MKELSLETFEWLASNVLAGFSETRRPWWASGAEREGHLPNLYPAEVPMDEVIKLIASWSPYTETLYTADMEEVTSHKLVRASDTKAMLAVVGKDYASAPVRRLADRHCQRVRRG